MGEIEHAGTAKTMPAITSDDAAQVTGEIIDEPTDRTSPAPEEPRRTDKIARERGMPPISRR